MANIKSQQKRILTNERRRVRNKSVKSSLHTAVRGFRAAIEAGEAGADYVAFGAFYQTQSKMPRSRATPEILEWWHQLSIVQSVAIGGITAENCAPLVRAGADFLAVIAAVWDHPDGPGAGVKAINDAIAEVATA